MGKEFLFRKMSEKGIDLKREEKPAVNVPYSTIF
jgi:hypothetical protein